MERKVFFSFGGVGVLFHSFTRSFVQIGRFYSQVLYHMLLGCKQKLAFPYYKYST